MIDSTAMKAIRVLLLIPALALGTACSSSTDGEEPGSPPPTSASAPGGVSAAPTAPAPSPTSSSSSSVAVPSPPIAVSTAPPGFFGSEPPGPPAPSGATTSSVLRPVTSTGAVVAGWNVHASSVRIICSPAQPSPVAVNAGIAYCSPSAASAIACWREDAGHALCLIDPVHRVLEQHALSGSFATPPAPARPAPYRLTLADGTICSIRIGGTGVGLAAHPDWAQYYFCGGDSAVYAPPNGTGVDTSSSQWTVELGPADGAGDAVSRTVTSATFVGTAGA